MNTDMKVAELMQADGKIWNTQLLNQYFSSEQIREITSIRIPKQGQDKLRWSLTSCGAFTTKSTYNELTKHNKGASTLHHMEGKGWLKLWHLEVAHKVQMFLWKCCQDILPVNQRLFNKRDTMHQLCPMCQLHEESRKFVGAMAYSAVARNINQAEVLVLLQALHWIKQLDYKQVIIEGDNLAVVNCCNGDFNNFKWEDQHLLQECQSLLSRLESSIVSFQRRMCNQAADKLAKFARTSIHFQIWWNDPPSIIYESLVQDNLKGYHS
ncbi:uncharacterized protein LOC113300114 [Papaver somniferum]|uniref:uncharacterized protein LOC113300114 n=1 Tax=Papaver somniferum TaxID=3469 RepID=UPI000E703D97|nr:uncharacterized protein LOC113300114 [Papaver somniferum]